MSHCTHRRRDLGHVATGREAFARRSPLRIQPEETLVRSLDQLLENHPSPERRFLSSLLIHRPLDVPLSLAVLL